MCVIENPAEYLGAVQQHRPSVQNNAHHRRGKGYPKDERCEFRIFWLILPVTAPEMCSSNNTAVADGPRL